MEYYYEVYWTDGSGEIANYDEAINICEDEELSFSGKLDKIEKYKMLGEEPNLDHDELVSTLWTAEDGFVDFAERSGEDDYDPMDWPEVDGLIDDEDLDEACCKEAADDTKKDTGRLSKEEAQQILSDFWNWN